MTPFSDLSELLISALSCIEASFKTEIAASGSTTETCLRQVLSLPVLSNCQTSLQLPHLKCERTKSVRLENIHPTKREFNTYQCHPSTQNSGLDLFLLLSRTSAADTLVSLGCASHPGDTGKLAGFIFHLPPLDLASAGCEDGLGME